jgi:hypothetical protein
VAIAGRVPECRCRISITAIARIHQAAPLLRGPVVQFADGSFTAALIDAAAGTVVLVEPDQPPRPLTRARTV